MCSNCVTGNVLSINIYNDGLEKIKKSRKYIRFSKNMQTLYLTVINNSIRFLPCISDLKKLTKCRHYIIDTDNNEHWWTLIFTMITWLLKLDSHLPKKVFICFSDSPSKMMKNAFYFILKVLFILKIFKFLSSLSGHVEKTAWLERRLISKFVTSLPG